MDCNDIESVLIRSSALDAVLFEYQGAFVHTTEADTFGLERVRELLRKAGAQLGAYRAAEQKFIWRSPSSAIGRLNVNKAFLNPATLEIDRHSLADFIRRGFSLSYAQLEGFFDRSQEFFLQFGMTGGYAGGMT